MTKSIKRQFTLILTTLLIAATSFGCKTAVPAASATPELTVITTAEPGVSENVAVPETDAPPAPTPLKDTPEAQRLLSALDTEVFRLYATDNGFSLHQLLQDPAALGIIVTADQMTWGDLSAEADQAYTEQCVAFQARLADIDRDALTVREQLSYDVIEQYLDFAVQDGAFEYYYEPLAVNGGLQSNLPMALALYELNTKADVENYMLLLADVPRYFGQILSYERSRAERGMFMTQEALSSVVADCNDIIAGGDDIFLKATFADAIDKIDGLTKAEKKAYKQQNEDLIKASFLPAYTSLRDGLQGISAECRAQEGMYAFGEEGLEYFALMLQMEGCTLLTPEEALELLDETLQDMLSTVQSIYTQDPSAASDGIKLTSGKVVTDLDFVKKIAESVLPKLPEHTVTLEEVPKELAAQFSAAAYKIPTLDAWTDNTILINAPGKDTNQVLLLAHEAYPGHLYQHVYQRSLEGLGLTQRALSYPGCAEGWAQYAEELVAVEQDKYDQNAIMFQFCNSIATNVLIPAIVSIDVNYFAYERDDVSRLLTQYGLDGDRYAPIYYNYAVTSPFYTLQYAIGYAQLSTMMRGMSESLGEAYLQQEVLQQYLDYGPAYFNLVSERMDEWADAKIME